MNNFRQDMPPQGGFKSVVYKRIPLKPAWPPIVKFGIVGGIMAVGWYEYHMSVDRIHYNNIEKNAAFLSLTPMLTAEADRYKLKQIRINMEEEARLMKDVKGWVVGTLYGEKVYKTLDEDKWIEPSNIEYFAHTDQQAHENALRVLMNN